VSVRVQQWSLGSMISVPSEAPAVNLNPPFSMHHHPTGRENQTQPNRVTLPQKFPICPPSAVNPRSSLRGALSIL
jgi:hypothetical protein